MAQKEITNTLDMKRFIKTIPKKATLGFKKWFMRLVLMLKDCRAYLAF